MLAPHPEPSIYSAADPRAERLSFIWVCEHDRDDIEATIERYLHAMPVESRSCELIVVNNGLGARISHRIVNRLHGTPLAVSLISFSMPCPDSTALSVAFQNITGDVVVLLPAYPQSDPQEIVRMLEAADDGLDYVASWRTPRIDSMREQRRSRLFNMVTRWFSGVNLHDINSGLRVMRREVVQNLPLYGDHHIFLPILAARQGFKVGEVPVRHLEERPGKPNSSTTMYLRRALDLLTLLFLMRFTRKPFRFFGGIGAGLLGVGSLINLVLAVQRLFFGQDLADRPMLILATLFMVLGIQTFSLGLLGELIIFVDAGGISDFQVERVYESTGAECCADDGDTPHANRCTVQ